MKRLWRLLCRMSHNGHFAADHLKGWAWCCHQDPKCEAWRFGCDR